jgi:hypothetical protein
MGLSMTKFVAIFKALVTVAISSGGFRIRISGIGLRSTKPYALFVINLPK